MKEIYEYLKSKGFFAVHKRDILRNEEYVEFIGFVDGIKQNLFIEGFATLEGVKDLIQAKNITPPKVPTLSASPEMENTTFHDENFKTIQFNK